MADPRPMTMTEVCDACEQEAYDMRVRANARVCNTLRANGWFSRDGGANMIWGHEKIGSDTLFLKDAVDVQRIWDDMAAAAS